MKRVYDLILKEHLNNYRQMAFVSGPRQVGKTTTCRSAGTFYLDWDNPEHQQMLLAGPSVVADAADLKTLHKMPPVLVFDELHKYPHWRNYLKGFFDVYENNCRILVTGSSRLDVYRRGGDSLMGRYFPFRMHPLSIAELNMGSLPGPSLVHAPTPISDTAYQALWKHGGFPEPFLKANTRFSSRWRRLRHDQLFKTDLRDLTRIQELALLEILGRILESRSSEQLVLSNLARDVGTAPNTAKSWVDALCALHFGFLIRPWHRNVTSALRKEPKWYLRDWSGIQDSGQRAETFVACHLLKAVEGWTDLGWGDFALHYIRNKQKQEVDFLVARDGEPWFLVEAKQGEKELSPALAYFQEQTGAPHAFQVSFALDYVDADCFTRNTPTIVPAKTFLSQLL